MNDLAGQWVGNITGINSGAISIDITGIGWSLNGTIKLSDREFGFSTYVFVGIQVGNRFELAIAPHESPKDVSTGPGKVVGTIRPDGTLAGVWETEIGTAGTFTASRSQTSMSSISHESQDVSRTSRRSSMTPLWLISIFVSLCEVVAGLAVTQAQGGVQVALTAFVIVFPLLVAGAFFAILWYKPYVLYPPTEFGSGTNVSEYVQALGGMSPIQAAEQQMRILMRSPRERLTPSVDISPPIPKAEQEPRQLDDQETIRRRELASTVIKFFAFRRMRYSDVSNLEAQAIFNLGAYQGFNLFDGIPGVAFFGLFSDLDPVEIVARVRFLLNNIELSYRRIHEHPDLSQREAALRILNQLSVEVLVPEGAPIESIKAKIAEYRPEGLTVPVTLHRPSDIERIVKKEYERMGLS
jgi:hypothetical protein